MQYLVYTDTKNLLVVYLKFKVNGAAYILLGNPTQVTLPKSTE